MLERTRSGWFWILTGSGLVLSVSMAFNALSPVDREALAYSIMLAGGLVLAWWRPRLAAAGLGALYLNLLVWMIPAAVSNLQHPGRLSATLLPGALAVAGSAGTLGAIGTLLRRGDRRGPVVVFLVACASLGVLFLLSGTTPTDPADPADIEMDTRDMGFDPATITVGAGEVTVRVRNEDLFWHTFTVPEVGVDVAIPPRGERAERFTAPPGTYEFICAIPGHTQLGMRGTMRVR